MQHVYFKEDVPFTASRTHVTIRLKLISLHFQLSHIVDGADALLFVRERQTHLPYKQIFTQRLLWVVPRGPDALHSTDFPITAVFAY